MNEPQIRKMVTFMVDDLPLEGYPVMDQIRKDSKLCDVTIKVLKCGWGSWKSASSLLYKTGLNVFN